MLGTLIRVVLDQTKNDQRHLIEKNNTKSRIEHYAWFLSLSEKRLDLPLAFLRADFSMDSEYAMTGLVFATSFRLLKGNESIFHPCRILPSR